MAGLEAEDCNGNKDEFATSDPGCVRSGLFSSGGWLGAVSAGPSPGVSDVFWPASGPGVGSPSLEGGSVVARDGAPWAVEWCIGNSQEGGCEEFEPSLVTER